MENLKKEILNYGKGRQKLVFLGKRCFLETKISMSEDFKSTELYKKIFEYTNFLPEETTLTFRLKAILQNITYVPKCPVCGKPCAIYHRKDMTMRFFNDTCESNACIAKFNHINETMSSETKNKHKIAQTNLKNRMKLMYVKLVECFENGNFNVIERDVVKNHFKTKLINNDPMISQIADNFIRDNFDFVCSIFKYTEFITLKPHNEIKSKTDLKLQERIYCILNDIYEKQKCRFCDELSPFMSFKKGYSISCNSCITDKIRFIKGCPTLPEIKSYIDTNKYEIINFPQKTDTDKLIIKCKKCNSISEHSIHNGKGRFLKTKPLCNNCEHYSSSYENTIAEFLRSCGFKVDLHRRDVIEPYELDLFVESKRIAIEIDGAYWHNSEHVNKNYHLFKTNICEQNNIKLIHIFEAELMFSLDIVKSRLMNIFGVTPKTFFARKCIVKEIPSHISKKFQLDNHIQGVAQSSVNLGLFLDDELLSIMTFGKSRFNKKYEWELVRYCNKLNTSIVGGASKILKYFEKNYYPKSLISYADRRWSQGSLYEKLGFTYLYSSKPDYWYYKHSDYKLLNRISFQKHKLKSKLEKFNHELTEYENMKNNGFRRIYDCGNMVFEKTY